MTGQAGYMMEVPILMALSGALLAILLPLLPEVAGKILVTVFALTAIVGLYYMILVPGWRPGQVHRSRIQRFTWFGLAVGVVMLAAGGYVIFA